MADSNEKMNLGRPDYTLLTISRFFAALWVVIYHIVIVIQADKKGGAGILENPVSKLGFMGVPFFFVLSGFILGKLYTGPKIDFRSFYVKRFLRIYPSYFMILLALVLIPAINFPRTFSYCAPVFLLVHSWIPEASQNLLPPAWSLACEAFFYLLYPFVFLKLINPSRLKVGVVIGLSLVPPVIALVWGKFGFVGNYVFSPAMHLPSFLLGILFANMKSIRMSLPLVTVGCVLFIAVAKVLFRDAVPLKVGLAALPFAVLISALANAKQPDSKSQVSKLLIFQGNASYVLYLIHFPLLVVMRQKGYLSTVMDAILAVLVVVAAASVFYIVFDRPFHIWATRMLNQKKAIKLSS